MSAHHGQASVLAARVRHLEALLEQHGLVDPKELDRALTAFLARASPASGARVVARAWIDDDFRQRLLADANAALPELDLSMSGGVADEQRLKVVENTERAHTSWYARCARAIRSRCSVPHPPGTRVRPTAPG